jgi:hypothetical protein
LNLNFISLLEKRAAMKREAASKDDFGEKWHLDTTFMHLFSIWELTLLLVKRLSGIFTKNAEHFTLLP